jgi:hypothetical protein
MKALSLTQPWAWLVVHGGKDVENRVWNTHYRGRFLIHAAKGMTKAQWLHAFLFVEGMAGTSAAERIPRYEALQRGGIVGAAVLWDVVPPTPCPSLAWQMPNQFGFRLASIEALPFRACKGSQRWWNWRLAP